MTPCADCGSAILDGEPAVTTTFGPVHEKSCFTSWKACMGGCGTMLPWRHMGPCPPCLLREHAASEQPHRAAPLESIDETRVERWMRKGDELEWQWEHEQRLDEDAQAYWRGTLTDKISPDERRQR